MISFGNTGENTNQGDTTVSYNNDGNYLVVGIDTTANTVTGISYAGSAMTQIGTTLTATSTGRFISFWGLLNPALGTNNISISGGTNQNVAIASISNVDTGTPISGTTTNSSTSSTASISVTTTIDNAYVLGFALIRDYSSLGTNTSIVKVSKNTVAAIYRTTSAVSPAGSSTLTVNTTGGEWDFIATGINPAPTTAGNLLMMGV